MRFRREYHITKKIGNSHIVWFLASNSWIQLEEPAWFAYQNFVSGVENSRISEKISKKYGLSIAESNSFVKEIIKDFRKLSSHTYQPPECFPAKDYKSPSSFYACRSYLINKKIVEISYSSARLEHIIHVSFAHLESKKTIKPHFRLETFSAGYNFLLKIGDKVWKESDPNFLKRKLFIELTNLIYRKTENDWLSYIHGSAVCNEKESVILTTACGSGKSTLAALLCNEGFKFVSDDYVPIDARYCKAFPFPAALSVKDGAFPVLFPHYEQLKDAPVYHFKGTNKTVKYLPFPDSGDFYKALPARKLVFVQYNSEQPFSFRKVPTLEAIKRFNEEAWLSARPEHARKFLKWFPGLECWELEYSDNDRAVEWVKGLFGEG